MPKVSPEYLDARRQEVLDAALTCFALRGFRDTTIEDIAVEAGLSHGAIYRYFEAKDEIIEAVSGRDRFARARRFEDVGQGGTAIDVLDRLFSGYLGAEAASGRRLQRQLRVQVMGEAVRNPRVNATLRNTWEDALGRVAGIVRRGQAAGEIDPTLDPDAVARVLAAVHDGLVVHQAVDPGIDAAACVVVFRALMRSGLRAAAMAGREETSDGREPALHPATA
jgi:AcrR family transcriptional regulator